MSKFLYPIFKLPNEYKQDLDIREIPIYIKWWLYNHYKRNHTGVLSDILTGTSFDLANTVLRKFNIFEIQGNTEQTQLSGKNLLDLSKCTLRFGTLNSDNSITSDINDGYYTQINTNSLNSYLLSHKGQSITFSIDKVLENKLISIVIYGQRENSTYQDVSVSNSRTVTLTIANDFTSITGLELRINRSNTKFTDTTTTVSQLMLEEGTTATDYEPYCGGIPSPNPEYPQPIYNVTGNVNNKIENKNLFDISKISNTSVITRNNDELIITNNVYSDSGKKLKELAPHLKVGQVVILSMLSQSNYKQIYLQGSSVIWYNNTTKTITEKMLNSNVVFYGVANETITISQIQIEQGSTATDYVEHQEQNLPFTLEEGQKIMLGDTLQDDGIHHERKQIVLDGTENWGLSGLTSNNQYYLNINDIKPITSYAITSNLLCSHLKYIPGITGYNSNNVNGISGWDSKQIRISLDINIVNRSVSDFKALLAEQYNNGTPVTVEYELAEEEIIPYNSTQQAQYNAIKKAMSYNDQTNISSESDEVGMIIDATAVGDINKVINNLLSN